MIPEAVCRSRVSGALKKIDALEKERQRIENLKKYEKEYAQYTYICGIDEVGRGPLAGPVVAGAVILPKDCDILYVNDSKQLSEKKERRAVRCDHEGSGGLGSGLCFSGADR